jgi:hypothetical protein
VCLGFSAVLVIGLQGRGRRGIIYIKWLKYVIKHHKCGWVDIPSQCDILPRISRLAVTISFVNM